MTDAPLAVPAQTETFGPGDRDRLLARLAAHDRVTLMLPLDRPEQLLLGADGRTQAGGLRLSELALRQVCRLASTGLVHVVTDLAGQAGRRPRTDADSMFSRADAAHVYNMVVRRRFRAVEGMQLVRDSAAGVVEGVVGSGYRRISNGELVELVEETLAGSPAAFAGATLVGRALTVRYLTPRPLPLPGDPFRAGAYFANSEVGDQAARAFPLLHREFDGGQCLAGLGAAAKVKHNGKDFRRRLGRQVSAVADRLAGGSWADLPARVDALRGVALGLGRGAEADERRTKQLAKAAVARKNLTVGLGRRVVRAALARPADAREAAPDPRLLRREDWAARTWYDLFAAAAREAAALPPPVRERLEVAAYAVLYGRPAAAQRTQ